MVWAVCIAVYPRAGRKTALTKMALAFVLAAQDSLTTVGVRNGKGSA
jgi:hypothetical protein